MKKSNTGSKNYNIPIETVLNAYKQGLFPMAETAKSKEIYWIEPKKRGIFFFDKIKIPSKLKKLARSNPFEIAVNMEFHNVIENCSRLTSARQDTWINETIKIIYLELFEQGHAHSVECYLDKKLVGGLYGVSIGGVFFGESMFSLVTNSSKFALLHLIERLSVGEYDFIDTQFINDHLKRFGAVEVTDTFFKRILKRGIKKKANFFKFFPSGFIPNNLLPLKRGNFN